jgi:hypothetical protein
MSKKDKKTNSKDGPHSNPADTKPIVIEKPESHEHREEMEKQDENEAGNSGEELIDDKTKRSRESSTDEEERSTRADSGIEKHGFKKARFKPNPSLGNKGKSKDDDGKEEDEEEQDEGDDRREQENES